MNLGCSSRKMKCCSSLSVLVLLLLCPSLAAGIPTPLGIDGTIYELDGITLIPSGISFSVENINAGTMVSGKTGYGSSGGYAASLGGSNGDVIIVRAWNKYNSANTTVALTGVMHGVNFVLNMTYPPLPPNITTDSLVGAVEDEPYAMQIEAFDENREDELVYVIHQGPTGLTLDAQSALLEWVPDNDDVGNHSVMVAATDGVHITNASFMLEVEGVNDPPSIISIPQTIATEDLAYQYDAHAIDVDSPSLRYSLMGPSQGITINSTSGLISWTPRNFDVGPHAIEIMVSDGMLNDTQSYVLEVVNTNDLPAISSLPLSSTLEDEEYAYQVIASDDDADAISYSLLEYPLGMVINGTSGLIIWNPGNSDVGIHKITLSTSDTDGEVNQSYALQVLNVNDAPSILSSPPASSQAGSFYSYSIIAQDEDGDDLSYSLLSSPSGAYIDSSSHSLYWHSTGNNLGTSSFSIVVGDGIANITQNFLVQVSLPPDLPSTPSNGATGGGAGGGGGGAGAGSSKLDALLSAKLAQEKAQLLQRMKAELMEENSSSVLSGISVNDVVVLPNQSLAVVKVISSRPNGTQQIPTRVYKYLEIRKSRPSDQE